MAHEVPVLARQSSLAPSHASPRLPSQTVSNNIDSQPILLEPFNGFSDTLEELASGGRVSYPKLEAPLSDAGSGRQVDPDFSIELGNSSLNGLADSGDSIDVSRRMTILHERDDEGTQTSPEKPISRNRSASVSSDGSFPSLSEGWISASTDKSRPSTARAVASAIKARKPDSPRDLEYEEAMRRLDDDDDDSSESGEDGQQQHPSTVAQKLVEKPIERPSLKALASRRKASKPSSAAHIKIESASPSPPVESRLGRGNRNSTSSQRANGSPFRIPDASQVVSLVTSSPEPEPKIEEHYAEDSIDETYREPSLPTGSGWVKKSRSRRGVSVPAPVTAPETTAPKRFASSQSKHSADSRTTAALSSLIRARKKTLANMFYCWGYCLRLSQCLTTFDPG